MHLYFGKKIRKIAPIREFPNGNWDFAWTETETDHVTHFKCKAIFLVGDRGRDAVEDF